VQQKSFERKRPVKTWFAELERDCSRLACLLSLAHTYFYFRDGVLRFEYAFSQRAHPVFRSESQDRLLWTVSGNRIKSIDVGVGRFRTRRSGRPAGWADVERVFSSPPIAAASCALPHTVGSLSTCPADQVPLDVPSNALRHGSLDCRFHSVEKEREPREKAYESR
jgi:hypothetical protein